VADDENLKFNTHSELDDYYLSSVKILGFCSAIPRRDLAGPCGCLRPFSPRKKAWHRHKTVL